MLRFISLQSAVIHGGPGALGEMAPVAQELSAIGGVIEPMLHSKSIGGQLGMLHQAMKKFAVLPVISLSVFLGGSGSVLCMLLLIQTS
jgi:hypothetical protein